MGNSSNVMHIQKLWHESRGPGPTISKADSISTHVDDGQECDVPNNVLFEILDKVYIYKFLQKLAVVKVDHYKDPKDNRCHEKSPHTIGMHYGSYISVDRRPERNRRAVRRCFGVVACLTLLRLVRVTRWLDDERAAERERAIYSGGRGCFGIASAVVWRSLTVGSRTSTNGA